MIRDYYVYLHKHRTTGEVFYVGKGKDQRAYQAARNKKWLNYVRDNNFDIEIPKKDLTNKEALELERILTDWFKPSCVKEHNSFAKTSLENQERIRKIHKETCRKMGDKTRKEVEKWKHLSLSLIHI